MDGNWIAPAATFDGMVLRHDVFVRIEDRCVAEIDEAPRPAIPLPCVLTPGFVDLQVNGGGGALFNSDPTPDGLATILAAHRRFGTVAVQPTFITDDPDKLDAAADAIIAFRDRSDVIGFHIEGPHLSHAKRGTHDPRYLRPLDQRTIDVVERVRASGLSVMITLAPEAANADQVRLLARMGAIVSIGHTNATADDVGKLIDAGASCGTHLFNAMSPMTSRDPGAVGTILNADIGFGLICDGHHVDDRMIMLALRASRAPQKTFLVSDAMATVGGPDHFTLYGKTITLRDGRLVNAEGNLAGAHTTMADGVRRLVKTLHYPLERSLRMAITAPASVIGHKDLSTLIGRPISDILALDPDDLSVRFLPDLLGHPAPSDVPN